MALSSNSNAGSTETKVGAGALSNFNTENKSNGNFSGGDINFDTSKLSINNPFNTNEPQQPTFNTDDVFKPTLSGNLDIDLPKTNNNNNTTYSNNSKEPTMTVDEVYGKSNNQPVVEKQGDYSASSNEKSNVETSTFGKQDEVSVTPTSVTENKGMVGNATIQSVKGLDFQQKDKASVDVLDSKKKRDEVESEDKADSMRNKLKAGVNNAKQEEGGEDFRIGTSEAEKAFNKENARRQAELEKKKKAAKDANNNAEKIKQDYLQKEQELDKARENALAYMDDVDKLDNEYEQLFDKILNKPTESDEEYKLKEDQYKKAVEDYIQKIKEVALKNNLNIELDETDPLFIASDAYSKAESIVKQKEKELNDLAEEGEKASEKRYYADIDYNKAQKEYNTWKKDAEANLKVGNTPEPETSEPEPTPEPETSEPEPTPEPETSEPEPTPQSGAETSYKNAIDAIENSEDATPEQKAQAEEVITNLEESRKEVAAAAAKARSGNPADMVAYQKALENHNKRIEEAQKKGNRWTQTDFNKKFTKAIMDSKDFKVTLSDGTEMDFSDFMTEEATKSPQYAKAMYEKKAEQFEQKAKEAEENGNKVSAGWNRLRAKIEGWKAEWSQTTLGSKFTFADNKVRNQFYQFADTNMRATYATSNNVLNDDTGEYSDEDKANALKDIEQGKALKTAATVLKASTGVFSGAGDDPSDGVFGTTDAKSLTDDQRTAASIKMFIQAALGLGISPSANKAYQTYYYLNRGDESIFENDLDNDGFTWVEEYGNSAAAGLILAAGEVGVGVVLLLNPASFASGANLIFDATINAKNSLFGVRDDVDKLESMNNDILEYFKDAENIAESSGNEEAVQEITNAITQIENFELKSDEVGNLDNWLEGSGSNTASNEKFNQSLTYDEWLKLIEADPTMREYAKSIAKKKDKDAQKDNADTGVNS